MIFTNRFYRLFVAGGDLEGCLGGGFELQSWGGGIVVLVLKAGFWRWVDGGNSGVFDVRFRFIDNFCWLGV